MKKTDFKEWLIKNEHRSERVAIDINSRLRRVMKLLNTENINDKSLREIDKNREFNLLTMTVKSQLRKAIKLYCDYKEK